MDIRLIGGLWIGVEEVVILRRWGGGGGRLKIGVMNRGIRETYLNEFYLGVEAET